MNNHVNYHGSVKDCNVKLLSYYNIAITTKSKRPLNIVRRYQKRDENNDRKRHGQTQFIHSEDRKLNTYCVVQTYRIPSVQLEGFGSSYIGSCCSSLYLYVLVLYLTLRNTPYLLLRYLRKLGNDHVQLCKLYKNV
jgi:hypothetical protein